MMMSASKSEAFHDCNENDVNDEHDNEVPDNDNDNVNNISNNNSKEKSNRTASDNDDASATASVSSSNHLTRRSYRRAAPASEPTNEQPSNSSSSNGILKQASRSRSFSNGSHSSVRSNRSINRETTNLSLNHSLMAAPRTSSFRRSSSRDNNDNDLNGSSNNNNNNNNMTMNGMQIMSNNNSTSMNMNMNIKPNNGTLNNTVNNNNNNNSNSNASPSIMRLSNRLSLAGGTVGTMPFQMQRGLNNPNNNNTNNNNSNSLVAGTTSNNNSVVPTSNFHHSSVVRGSFSAAREVDDKTRALLQDMNEFDANQSEIEAIAEEIFSSGTGISIDEIKKIMRVRVSSKAMDLDQQIAASNKVIRRLKDTLNDLMRGKSDFVSRAIQADKAVRAGWAQAIETAQLLDEDRGFYRQKVKQLELDNTIWKDNAKDTMRELSLSEDKMQNLRDEVEDLKRKLAIAENEHTQSLIALEVAKARNEENEKNLRVSQATIVSQEAIESRVKEVQRDLKQEHAKEMEKMNLLIESKATKIKELESQLIIAESQFARAISDCEAAEAKAKSKDQDMSELMKSITDVQSAGQLREEEANKMRREAEAKVSELEKTLATTRGELTVFTHEKGTLRENLDIAKQERADALASLDKVKEQMDKLKSELNSAKSQLTLEKELRARSDLKEREERNERIALSAQMMAMTKEHAQMETYLKENQDVVQSKFKKELDTQIKLVEEKELELQRSNERIVGLLGEIETLQSNLQNEKSVAVAECAQEMSKMSAEISIMKERMKVEEQKYANVNAQSQEKVLALEKQILEAQTERRRMHNLIQELRGNVRVFARCRPFLPDDGVGDDEPPCVVPKSETSLKLLLDGKADKTYNFEFDRVFPPSAGQEAVFTEVSEFVQSALDGYQVCLFSYGQTGSGKTHTMQGSGLGQMRGIIPRSIEQVGAYKEQLERDGWQYDMQVSFLEIYNEAIRDLLRGDDEPPVKLDIKKSADGRRFVQDLNLVSLDPKDSDAVEAIMRQAAKHRAVGCTDMNAVSSRSHSVFTLHLTAKHPENRQSLRGTLNLVDLAGSERLDRSGATGDRQKEAVAINKSLSSLIDVFTAIGNKQSHIPFRNSKLTYLLQPCLCGDGKTLMMVNLSPTELSTQESLCSLRFAANVNKCELGKAKRSLEEIDDDDDDGRSVSSATTSFTYSQARKPVGRASSKISAGSSISKGSMRSPSGKPRAVR